MVRPPEPETGTGPVHREERPAVPVVGIVGPPTELESVGLKDIEMLTYDREGPPWPVDRVGPLDDKDEPVALGFHVGFVNEGNEPVDPGIGTVIDCEYCGPVLGRKSDELPYDGIGKLSELGCGRGGTPGIGL